MSIRVTVWHEFRHEKTNPLVAKIYPQGIHEAIAGHLRKNKLFDVSTATLDDPLAGLSDEKLAELRRKLGVAVDELPALVEDAKAFAAKEAAYRDGLGALPPIAGAAELIGHADFLDDANPQPAFLPSLPNGGIRRWNGASTTVPPCCRFPSMPTFSTLPTGR